MPASLLVVISVIVFLVGYILYGRFLTRRFDINPERKTPAHTMHDGVDYVPAKTPVLLGHHFASIAGAGPILGPVYAAVFGWIPVFLWILIGSVFFGGVHDFSSIVASVRHGGKSIGEVIEDHIGHAGKRLFLIFAWFTLILVIAVFCRAVASTFIKSPPAATASVLFIGLAVIFGLGIYRLHVHLGLATLLGVILLLGCVALGMCYPMTLPFNTWIYLMFVYVFIAAVAPVWILLQPRGFLNSFLLYFVLIGGLIGIFVANPKITFPAITQFKTNLGYLFPILFVTVACGAISGFHSLVASGTTAKQINRETDAWPVGYGSMLIEGLLAVVALITAVTILRGDYARLILKEGGGPIGIFSQGVGGFISSLGIPIEAAVTFAALAISSFVLTTLDTATRLARFIFEEFFEREGKASILTQNRYIGTLITILFAGFLALSGTGETLWPMFGSANQLLAAIALLAVTVWLAELRRENRFAKYPMYFMFCVTLTALGSLIYKNWITKNWTLFSIALLLLVVAFVLVFQAGKSLRRIGVESRKAASA